MKSLSIFWFRRDLRLSDNAALAAALASGNEVLPIYIFDKQTLSKLSSKEDARVTFVHDTLKHLQQELLSIGSTLLVLHSDVPSAFHYILEHYHIQTVYANACYEPQEMRRDIEVSDYLYKHNIPLHLYKDNVIFEKSEVMRSDGKPYLVFTGYERAWKNKLLSYPIVNHDSESHLKALARMADIPIPTLQSMGMKASEQKIPKLTINTGLIEHYQDTCDYPWIPGTTHLGIHIRYGTVSIRKLVHTALLLNATWLSELIRREFYIMLLFHYPQMQDHCFKPKYDRMRWRRRGDNFKRWCEGRTGYPLVDAGISQLLESGMMHGRIRKIAATFLVKNLLVDWRDGADFFAQHLLDYDLALNVGNWQSVAGCGIDTMPVFRFFNPADQAKKYDIQGLYQQQWLSADYYDQQLKPCVDFKASKQRYIETYLKVNQASADDMD